jgi:hypothetical protein
MPWVALALSVLSLSAVSHASARTNGPATPRVGPAVGATSDFNGDRFADVAIGVPFESIGQVENAGAVSVLYGSGNGLSASSDQLWSQDSPGIEDHAENDDGFGRRFATADFDGDGFADLAVGAPSEELNQVLDAGAFHVIYGSPDGLTAQGSQFWTEDAIGGAGSAQPMGRFGDALTGGDFDGDGYADLAVAAPGDRVGVADEAGLVRVLYGSAEGLTLGGVQLWTQDSPGILDQSETGDEFGDRVGSADLNADGSADLVVDVPDEDEGTISDSGAFHVLYGSASGLTSEGNQFWTEDSPGIPEASEEGDKFAEFDSAGDFDGDGFPDLAVSAPAESIGTATAAGVVIVIFGSASGLTEAGSQLWSQDADGIREVAEALDGFGRMVRVGDFNGDGFADLAAGVPGETVEPTGAVGGSVNVLYGSMVGLTATGNQLWSQDSRGVRDIAEDGDEFARYGGAGDFDGDGWADLALGVPFEDVGVVTDAGAVNVLYGSALGLTAVRNQLWTQDVPGVVDRAEADDEFGKYVFAAG